MKPKIKWSKDKDGWFGMMYPCFSIFKNGRQWTLQILEPKKNPENNSRFLEVDSVQQGKNIAAEIIKQLFEANR